MYASLWQILPGGTGQKAAILGIAAACLFALLMLGVFPLVESWIVDPAATTTVGEPVEPGVDV